MNFGAKLLGLMTSHNLTIRDVAGILEVPSTTVHRWLCGQGPPSQSKPLYLPILMEYLHSRLRGITTTSGSDTDPVIPV